MTGEAASRWARAWERAWCERRADFLAGVYAERCRFRSHPFRELESPLDYARGALANESDVDARFGEPIVAGDRAAVEWWATLAEAGEEITLAGVSWLRFDEDDRVVEQRDYWAQGAGRMPPPEEWGS